MIYFYTQCSITTPPPNISLFFTNVLWFYPCAIFFVHKVLGAKFFISKTTELLYTNRGHFKLDDICPKIGQKYIFKFYFCDSYNTSILIFFSFIRNRAQLSSSVSLKLLALFTIRYSVTKSMVEFQLYNVLPPILSPVSIYHLQCPVSLFPTQPASMANGPFFL